MSFVFVGSADNASNNVLANILIKEKCHVFWTPCATHRVDLMLENVGKIRSHANTIKDSRSITTSIHKHNMLVS